jgi:Ca-activated chloride channel family protein
MEWSRRSGWVAVAGLVLAGPACQGQKSELAAAVTAAAPAASAPVPAEGKDDKTQDKGRGGAFDSDFGAGAAGKPAPMPRRPASRPGADGRGEGVVAPGFLGPQAAATAPADPGGLGLIGTPGHERPSAGGAPVQALVPIDPNGRFATTYRPGGGHLAAFESAVARGIIPTAEREVVSDVGARYTTPFDVPKGKALAVHTDLERGKIAPAGGPFHVRVQLRSTADRPAERPHLSVHLVLDVSGSMAGESITNARAAASALVDKLLPTDDFSLVTFSNEATLKVPDGLIGARRDAIKKIIADIHEGGGTNISGALTMGYAQASAKTIPDDAVRVVLLLSDGHANMGMTAPDKIAKLASDAFQNGIQTSSFGLGPDYDGALMSGVAAEGAGGYYYLRDAQQIAPALATEIDKRLDPVATAVELRFRLKKDVSLLHVYGSRRLTGDESARVRAQEVAADVQAQKRDKIGRDRQDDAEGGMRFFIPAFARDDSHALLFQLSVAAGAGTKGLGTVEIKYKDRVTKKNVVDEYPISVAYADSDAASGASIDASVARTVQGFAAGEALSDAAARIARNDRQGAVAELTEREQILRQAAATLNEPLFLKDADRLALLRQHAGIETGLGDPLVLALMLETAGRSHLH